MSLQVNQQKKVFALLGKAKVEVKQLIFFNNPSSGCLKAIRANLAETIAIIDGYSTASGIKYTDTDVDERGYSSY